MPDPYNSQSHDIVIDLDQALIRSAILESILLLAELQRVYPSLRESPMISREFQRVYHRLAYVLCHSRCRPSELQEVDRLARLFGPDSALARAMRQLLQWQAQGPSGLPPHSRA